MDSLLNYLPNFYTGIIVTIQLTLASIVGSFALALLFTSLSQINLKLIRFFVNSFIFFVRGTPILVQIFLVYYGAGQFEWIRQSPFWIVLQSPFGCAVVTLSINSACYTTIIFMGAINSLPKNEIDACAALGMSKWLAFRRIIFPSAFRLALPAYSNEIVMILKSTSLASTITLLEIMGITQQLISTTYDTITLYLLAGCCYLFLNGIIHLIFQLAIRRSRAHLIA